MFDIVTQFYEQEPFTTVTPYCNADNCVSSVTKDSVHHSAIGPFSHELKLSCDWSLSPQREIVHLMAECGKTQRQIQTWFRFRRNQDRPSNSKKFGEAG